MSSRRFPPGPPLRSTFAPLKALFAGNELDGIPVFLADVARRYGGIAHWSILGKHFFLLDDAALIEDVLVTKARDYTKGPSVRRLKPLLGEALFTSEPPVHLRRRRMLQPAFHRQRIAGYGASMVAETLAFVAGWRDGAILEMDREMTRLTLAIAGETLFSVDASAHTETVRSAIDEALATLPTSFTRMNELLEAFPVLPATRRFLRARGQLEALIESFIAARRRDAAYAPEDLLTMLIDAADVDGGLDNAQVRAEALTIFLAGHETTASALSWTWYLLAHHPHVAERLYAELDDVLGGRAPDADDVPNLRYAHDVFAEAMRLYPPAWMQARRAAHETTLGEYVVPRGSLMLTSQFVTHRNPRYWDDPDVFRPERWTEADAARPRFAYFPFGGGNRRCIGEAFAWMEGVLVLATIASRFAVEAIDAAPVETLTLVTLRPRTAVRVRLRARASTRSA